MVIDFMDKAKGLTKNPLGIIALFVSLIYGFACLVLSTSVSNLHTPDERIPLIWFIIIFPFIILIGFIYLVVKHHEKLYGPSDYRDPESFIKTFANKGTYQEIQLTVTKDNLHDKSDFKETVLKSENTDFNNVLFSPKGKMNLEIANETFKSVREQLTNLVDNKVIKSWGFGVQAPEYYLFQFKFNSEYLQQDKIEEDLIIMRVTKGSKGNYDIIGIGKGIMEQSPTDFAVGVRNYLVDKFLPRILKESELIRLK